MFGYVSKGLTDLDVTWRHPRDVKESAYKGLVRPVLEYVVQLRTPTVYFFKMSLRSCRKGKLITLYKGLKGAARIPTSDFVPPNRRTRNLHSLAFQTQLAGTDIY